MDEPTTEVDRDGLQVVRDIFRVDRNRVSTLLITPYELDDVGRLSDGLVITNGGHVVIPGVLDKLRGNPEMIIGTSAPGDPFRRSELLGCVVITNEPRFIRIATESTSDHLATVNRSITNAGGTLRTSVTRGALFPTRRGPAQQSWPVPVWWAQIRAEVA